MKVTIESPAFDAGARTIGQLTGDGTFSFAVGQARGVACGLGPVDASATITDIRFGFLIAGDRYRIIVDGQPGTVYRSYSALSRFAITRSNGILRAYVDETLIETDSSEERRLLFGDCSLFAFGDTIEDAEIETSVANEITTADIGLGPIGAGGTQGVVAVGFAGLGPLGIVAKALEPSVIGVLWAKGSETANVAASVGVGHLDAYGTDFRVVGEYNFGDVGVGWLATDGFDGQISTTLQPAGVGWLATRSSDKANAAYGFASVGIVQVMAILSAPNRIIATAPAFAMSFEDISEEVSASLPIAVPTPIAHTGIETALSIPIPILAAQISGDWNVADLAIPVLSLTASMVDGTGQLAAPNLDIPVLRAAGVISFAWAELPVIVPTTIASVVDIDGAWGVLPAVLPTALGIISDERVTAVLPVIVPELNSSYLIHIETALPLPVLLTLGHVKDIYTEQALATLAVNLSHAGVTVPSYPSFIKMAPGFGLTSDGTLYRLGDAVEYPFARIKLPILNFDIAQRKRITHLYVHGRASEPLEAEIQADENQTYRYVSRVSYSSDSSIQRIQFGKGIVFWAASIAIEAHDGGTLNIGTIELLVDRKNKRTA